MRRLEPASLKWLASLAVIGVLALAGPSVLAEDEKAEQKKSPESGEAKSEAAPEPAPPLRVEQGRVMTNREAAVTKPAPKKKIEIEEGQVITNEMLEKIFGPPDETATADSPPAPGATPAAGQPTPDPLQVMRESQMRQGERQRLTAEAEQELAAAKAKLANLEVQLLAARNPYAKRPDLSDEEKKKRAEGGETAAQRFERTQKMVDEAKAEVQAAEAKLAKVRSGS
jgi:hypothetical protein